MNHKPPEVRYDSEMPPEAQERFTAFMDTLNEHPDIVRRILDVYADDDTLIKAAATADEATDEGQALLRLSDVLTHGDEDFVEPDEAFHAKINRIFDRAERYNNTIDRRRTWFNVLVREAELAKGAVVVSPPATPKQQTGAPAVSASPVIKAPVDPETDTTPLEAFAIPGDERPVTISLIPPNEMYRRPIAEVIFMAPEYPDQE